MDGSAVALNCHPLQMEFSLGARSSRTRVDNHRLTASMGSARRKCDWGYAPTYQGELRLASQGVYRIQSIRHKLSLELGPLG